MMSDGRSMNIHRQTWISIILLLATHFHLSYADIGTASHYGPNPSYLPTACFGNDQSQFPSSNLFAAAGEGLWDNGASCGRKYLVRCISASAPGICNPNKIIEVKIIDREQTSVARPSSTSTIALSTTAFAAIANPSAASVNIEFQLV